MSSGSNFFICSCAILIFAITNFSIGPAINKKLVSAQEFSVSNCDYEADKYEKALEQDPNMLEIIKEESEYNITMCRNKKAMVNMEYTSFFFNTAIGLICVLLGLHALQKDLIPKTGLIGMVCGVVGFALTFVYIILNGIIYTNYSPNKYYYKIDGDGAFAELDGEKYRCLYFKKQGETRAIIAKLSDLIKSQYNYNKALIDSFKTDVDKNTSTSTCSTSRSVIESCGKWEYILELERYKYLENFQLKQCNKLYYFRNYRDYQNYDLSARFLTALLLSIIILLFYCGLIYSGFTMKKEQAYSGPLLQKEQI